LEEIISKSPNSLSLPPPFSLTLFSLYECGKSFSSFLPNYEESAFFSQKKVLLFSLVCTKKKRRSRVSLHSYIFDAQNISSRFARCRTQQTRAVLLIVKKRDKQFARFNGRSFKTRAQIIYREKEREREREIRF
jgi:hypothetical protein